MLSYIRDGLCAPVAFPLAPVLESHWRLTTSDRTKRERVPPATSDAVAAGSHRTLVELQYALVIVGDGSKILPLARQDAAALVKGSHGRRPADEADYPLLISPKPELLLNSTIEATDVYHVLKRHILS